MYENIAIAWTDLTVSVKPFMKSEKIILNNISGYFEFNKINALMGSSGSGKTTLLKCLNGSNEYFFSEESSFWVQKDIDIRKCFIYQNHDQRIMTGLTVGQALTYASKLKNSTESNVNHKEIISQVMTELLIRDIENNLVENCSGGQIKRICIGLELTAVHKPNVLIIDEPTTGLDSYAAETLIQCLKQLCLSNGMSIITSIHQPNNDLFQMFDSVYVLAKGGICVYTGPPNKLRQQLKDCSIEYTQNQIPIEVIIKLSFNGIIDENVRHLSQRAMEPTEELRSLVTHSTIIKDKGLKTKDKDSKIIDFYYLLLRFLYRNYYSKWKTLMKSLIIFMALYLLLVFSLNKKFSQFDGCFEANTLSSLSCYEKEEEKSMLSQNQVFIYFSGIIPTFIIMIIQVNSFVKDMKIFESEHQNMWYSSSIYWLARFIADTILIILYTVITILCTQVFREQVNDYYKFGLFFAIILMTYNIAKSYASIIGTLSSGNLILAMVIAIFVSCSLNNYNNYYFRTSHLPELLRINSEFNFYKYNFNSLITLFYGLGRCPDGQQSRVLIEFDLEDSETQFWKYFNLFIINSVVLIITEYLIFIIKAKHLKITCIRPAMKLKTNSEDEKGNSVTLNNRIKQNIDRKPEPTRSVMIAWLNISYLIEINDSFGKRYSKILNDLNGCFETQSLNAIMGPSGAGKTTLLKCLSGRQLTGLTEDSKIFLKSRIKCCFIVQNIFEHLLEGLTVRQTLIYASKLKNSRIIKDVDHKQIVSDLMAELLISDTADNRVESCSGGEQKRIVIAAELTSCNKPDILFIDEPTSGLDSNAAEVLINCLKSLCRNHRMTIVVSIHQPNQDLFQMFDQIYVLAKGGICVYSGAPDGLNTHLSVFDISCNENQIPFETLLKVSSNQSFNDKISSLSNTVNQKFKSLSQLCTDLKMRQMDGQTTQWKRFSFKDFYILLLRTMTYISRNQWKPLLIQFVVILFGAITMRTHFDPQMIEPDGCLEIELGMGCNQTLQEIHDEYSIKQNIKYNQLLMISIAFINIIVISTIFCTDFKVFRNEQKNCWYSTGSFIFAKTLIDLLPQMIFASIFCAISNLYNDPSLYLTFLFVNITIIASAQSIAQISAILFPYDPNLSLLVANFFELLMIQLGNNLVPLKELHYSLQMLSSLSYIKYGFQILMISIYGFGRCPQNQISTVLESFEIETQDFWPNVVNLIIVCCLYKALVFFVLILKINSGFIRKDKTIDENYCNAYNSSKSLNNLLV